MSLSLQIEMFNTILPIQLSTITEKEVCCTFLLVKLILLLPLREMNSRETVKNCTAILQRVDRPSTWIFKIQEQFTLG